MSDEKGTVENAVNGLAQKSVDAQSADDALKFSEAAFNLQHVLNVQSDMRVAAKANELDD